VTRTITVEGMSCDGCERTVGDALRDVEGVTEVHVDRTTNSASVEGDADADALVRAVEDAGYEATA
jgi:copper chaperone CopZ